jgi:hypothetical protein
MAAAAPTQVTSPWTAFVRSDVYAGPVNEDGERPDELSYYVVCENERGERFASTVTFTTEEFWHGTAEPRAEAFCAKVTEALAAGADPTKSSRWYRVQGCYGSAAYSEKLELELDARDIEAESGHEEADRFRKATGIEHAVGAP